VILQQGESFSETRFANGLHLVDQLILRSFVPDMAAIRKKPVHTLNDDLLALSALPAQS
jgi:hypothetical protein